MIRKLKKQSKKKKIPIQNLLGAVFVIVLIYAIVKFKSAGPFG